MIPAKYKAKGFYITRFGERSLALKRHDKAIYVFSSVAEINLELVSVLCECNLKVFGNKTKSQELAGVR
jgi:hypothetical protein